MDHFRILLAADLAVRALVFGTAIVAARRLGPQEFGYVSVALAAVSYAGVLGDGGLTNLAQLRLVRAEAIDDVLVTATGAVQVVLALTAAALLTGLMWLLPFRPEVRLLTVSALPVLLAQALSTVYVLQAAERMTAVAALRFLAQLGTTAATLGLLAAGVRGGAVTTSQWAGLLAADVVAGVLLRRARWRPARPDALFLRDFCRQAWPYLAALLSTQIIINADVVVLGLSRSGTEVGQYGAAFRLAGAGLSLVGIVMAATFPELVRRLAGETGLATSLILRLVRFTCRPGLAVTSVVILAASPLMRLFYGERYAGGADYLAILFLLVPLGFYNTILAQSLLAAGRQRTYLRAVGTTAVLTVAGLVLTVPAWGATAAAVVTVLGELTSVVVLTVLVRAPLSVRAWPVLLEQLPFVAVPLALGALSERALGLTAWEAAAVAAVAVVGCEALSPHPLLSELRRLLRQGTTA